MTSQPTWGRRQACTQADRRTPGTRRTSGRPPRTPVRPVRVSPDAHFYRVSGLWIEWNLQLVHVRRADDHPLRGEPDGDQGHPWMGTLRHKLTRLVDEHPAPVVAESRRAQVGALQGDPGAGFDRVDVQPAQGDVLSGVQGPPPKVSPSFTRYVRRGPLL